MIHELLEQLEIERTDDIPLLVGTLQKMRLAALLDAHFRTHGNWAGQLTLGEVVLVWLAFILSQADHRLNHVEPWAAQRLVLLSALLGKEVRALDFSDDRLAAILDALADQERWNVFEAELNGSIIRVYKIIYDSYGIRVDTTTSYTYTSSDDPDSIFQQGHSKDHRPDLNQIKIGMATLDPLGLPLVCTVVAGNCADDPLYIPIIQQVQTTLPPGGNTYFCDCKGAALETRAYVADSNDYFACPLSATQVGADELQKLLDPVFAGTIPLSTVYRPGASDNEPGEAIAEGYSYLVPMKAVLNGAEVIWVERRFVVCSFKHQQHQQKKLQERIDKALIELRRLTERKKGKKKLTKEQLQERIDGILDRYDVRGLINVEVKITRKRIKRRKHKDRPAGVRVEVTYEVKAQVKEQEFQKQKQMCGWRVYATNNLQMTLTDMVLGYRNQYGVENGFDRMKNQPLGLSPMYLQEETRVVGLVHLLGVGLRTLTLLEFVVRRNLKKNGEKLQNVYAGQNGRKTSTPSAELLLRAFKGINLLVETTADGTITAIKPLSDVQQRILELLDLPGDLYTRFTSPSLVSVQTFNEP